MSKIIKVVITIVILVLLVVLLSRKNSNQTIKIGAIFSLTGNGSAYGEPAKNGMRLAIEDINKNGGINGKMVEGIYEDSQFDAKIGLSAYQNLKSKGIRYILTNGSGVSLAVRKPVVDNHDLQFEVGAVTPLFSDGNSNTCRLALTAPVLGKVLGEFVVKNLKAKTFATLTLNDDYGKSMTDVVSKTLADNGVIVSGKDSFDKSASDFKTQITKLASLKPDVLLVVPAAGQAQAIFKQLKELNWKGIIVSDHFTIINDNLKDLSLVNGDYFVNYNWNVGDDSEKGNAFKVAYNNQLKVNPPVIAANTYDSLQLVAKGIAAVGQDDPEAVGKWLSSNIKDYQGVTGSISLDQDCEVNRPAVIQEIKDGKFEIVK